MLKSNVDLDLNNSKIIHEDNSSIRYTIFAIYNVENVKISNGIIIGDRNTHDYDKVDSTHEWGFGIELQGSCNIALTNLEIKELTGDGIMISGYTKENDSIVSEDITIRNSYIYDCRRQGISIVNGRNVEIYDNEIRNISGTSPASAIDIEPDSSTQIAENIEIYNNKLYNENNRLNVIRAIRNVKNVNIHNNEINGNISIYGSKDTIKIIENKISNGNMYFNISTNCIDNPDFANRIEMNKNIIINCDFQIYNVSDILINDNNMEKTRIEIISSNVAISNNIMYNLRNNEFITDFKLRDNDDKKYEMYIYNNVFPDSIENIELDRNFVTVYYDEKSYTQYIQSKFNV